MATDQGSDRREEKPSASSEKPAAELTVERVTHQDIPAICALYKRVWEVEPGLPVELVKAWVPVPLEFTSRMEGVTYFVARRGTRVTGVVGCETQHGACRIVQLAVEPENRRQGSATALVHAALDWAKRSNAATVWADPLVRFDAAARLFRKLGFSECGLLHRHEWGEDIRFFERVL